MAARGQRPSRLLDRNLAVLTERPGVPGVVLAVMAALLLIRAALFPGTGGDDGEQLVFSQFFDLGYQVRNPPLYTWLVIAVSKVTGANLWAVNLIKFALLAGMYLFLWRAGLRLFRSREMASLAALSPVLFYYLAWEVVTGFSHTVLAACLYAALVWVLVRLRDDGGRWADYLLLGLVIGFGIQAKYAFWIFLAAFLAAAAVDRDLRRRLFGPRAALTLAVAAAFAAPHYLWLVDRLDMLAAQAGETAAEGGGFSLTGLGHGVKAAIGFLSPFWLVALACFPLAFRPRPESDSSALAPHPMTGVLGWQMVLVLVGTAVGALALPDFRIRTHYMVVLLAFPLWLLLRAEARGINPGRTRAFAACLSLALLAAPVGMIGKYLFEPLTCGRCQHHVAYGDLARQIRDMGFTGGTIVAYWHPDPLPGNLRARFPGARVISAKHPDVIPPRRAGGDTTGQCLVVWSADSERDSKGPAVGAANSLVDAGISADAPHRLITAPLAGPPILTRGKTAALGVILTQGRGDCR